MIEKSFEATKRFEYYTYDTLEDLKCHMLYMKRKGYSVWEYNTIELYAEYEMCDLVKGTIKLEKEGDEDFV